MTWGRIGAILVTLLLFTGVAAAGSADIINSPEEKVYSDDRSVTVELEVDDPYELEEYRIPSMDITRNISNQSFSSPEMLEDGHHTLIVTASDGDETVEDEVDFTIDTTGPVVTDTTPDDVTFDRYPAIEIAYEDELSDVDPGSVTVMLNGDDVTGTGNVTDELFVLDTADVNISEGVYNVSVQVSDEHGNWAPPTIWTFEIPESPVLSGAGPTGIASEDVTLELTARNPTDIDTSASQLTLVQERDGNVVERVDFDEMDSLSNVAHGVEVTHKVESLEDGFYTVEADVQDVNGHVTEDDWSFVVDTTPPEIDLRSHSDGDIVKETQTVSVVAVDELSGVDEIRVELGDERESSAASSGDRASISIDTREVADGEQALVVYAYDNAGNRNVIERTLIVDNTPPTIHSIDVYPDIVTTLADITASVEDDATGVESVTYEISDTDVEGVLIPEDGVFNESREDVYGTMDLTDVDDGNYTLAITAEDRAGHTRTVEQDVTVDTGLSYELELQDVDPVLLTLGESETFDVTVRNRGDADDRVELDADANLVSAIVPEERQIRSGETRTFEVTVERDADGETGPEHVTMTAAGFTAETADDVLIKVQPTPEEQQNIEQSLQELKDEYDELSKERDSYAERVDYDSEPFEETRDLIADVDALIDDGQYHTAAERMSELETQIDEADTTVTGMASAYQRQRIASILLSTLVFLLLVGGFAAFYLMRPPEEGFRSDDGFVMHEDDRHPLHRKADELQQQARENVQRVLDRMTEEDQKTESRGPDRVEGWNGFDN